MEKTDRELLIKEISSRLPYGVNMHIKYCDLQGDGELASKDVKLTTGNICYCFNNGHWVDFKLYLHPMSSMTEEEYNCVYNGHIDFWSRCDYCNSHHLDYRGLIEKGLALEAPEGMYNTKNE